MALDAVNMYISANLLLLLAALGVVVLRRLSERAMHRIAYRTQLAIAYALSAAVLLLPWARVPADQMEFLPRSAQIWSAASMRDLSAPAEDSHRIAISVASSEMSAPLDTVQGIAMALFLVGGAVFAMLLLVEAARICRVLDGAQTIVRRRRVRVLSSQAVAVPFSLWVPGLRFIVVPADLILRPADLRMAIRHEAQHHRQWDTRVTYVYQLLRMLFFWNPAVHWLHERVAELQELACDEALVAQRKVSAQAYCNCLLRVAESAVRRHSMSICVGMLGGESKQVLRSRIEALVAPRSTRNRASAAMAFGGTVLVLMVGTTVAFSAAVQDRRISLEQAQQMLAVAQQADSWVVRPNQRILLHEVRDGGDFPFVMNERVLQQLNGLLGTPDGRAFMRDSLQRMQKYEALIAGALANHGLPPQLLAVPLAESGFRNLPPGDNPRHGAGLWMFIEPTAIAFGLRVDETIDERMNVAVETEAAMRMLGGLYERFGDWGLALLAYNSGVHRVEKAMQKTGSRDPWRLVEQGYENDRDYLARLMAVSLIMQNPAVLE